MAKNQIVLIYGIFARKDGFYVGGQILPGFNVSFICKILLQS